MPENQIPATQPQAGAAAGEFNFVKAETENPRIRRRSLKSKTPGLIKPAPIPAAARELEREAPPLTAEQVAKPPAPKAEKPEEVESKAPVKAAEPAAAPAHTTPATAPAAAGFVPKTTALPSSAATTKPAATSTSRPTSSPHGTRPATLYYSSNTRKAETPTPMKTSPTASSASSPASAAKAANPVTRIATTTSASASRPSSPTVDYRANVERQAREQKSVGSLLSYVVYGLIAFFVISAGLAGYGAKVIFAKLNDQSQTVSDLDARYGAATKDLSAKLAAAQDTINQAQTQIARQQDLIMKQQEELNRLITTASDNDAAIKSEKQARAQETAALRARVKELEYKTAVQKY